MVHPLAVAVLAERGIVWQGKRPKGIKEVQDASWDLVITVCDAARDACPVLPGAMMVHWGMADPARADPADQREAFRRTAEQLDRRVQRLLALPLVTMDGETLGAAAAAIHLQE
jgi:arsenate reductase